MNGANKMKQADFSVTPMISDHAIVQRDEPITVRGRGEPGHGVVARLHRLGKERGASPDSGTVLSAKVGEAGMWQLMFPPLPAGGPYEFDFECQDIKVTVTDVYVGDVWLLAGQSNMQLPMERVKYRFPQEYSTGASSLIRQFAVPIHWNFDEEERELSGGQWITAHPEDVASFSAVGFFFAEALFKRYEVPIGLVLTAVGGTPIQSWISRGVCQNHPEMLAETETYRRTGEVQRVQNADERRIADWWTRLDSRDPGLAGHWECGLPERGWKRFSPEDPWQEEPDLSGCGTVWLRTYLTVPKSHAGKPARLSLGTVTDADFTFVNGNLVGKTAYQYPPREYRLDGLTAGRNVIVMRLVAVHGTGGFTAGKHRAMLWDDGFSIDLGAMWEYRRGADMEPLEEQTFFERVPIGMYQAMIAPLHDFPIRGACWYQGEINTDAAEGYSDCFKKMVELWRVRWDSERLPVLFVQLPDYDLADATRWVAFRELQRGLLCVPDTAMVVTIDCGEANDLHPTDKKTVGDRLAMAASQLAYGESGNWLSPVFTSAAKKGDDLILSFEHTGDGLKTSDADTLKELYLRFADGTRNAAKARLEGDVVKVDISHLPLDRLEALEYACSNVPEQANLCNDLGLPASPFICELPEAKHD
ncbi:protein of unknown function DUF303 acetylesterase [Coriobacterium glomerans PW2]|uniref:Sialate O-acetylesterase domain-containing protein n=1 Tax=Coriobacterium glomerans (strain ATCC 49209 / DSM 20642 / JCM 10262 / PW2) TaxID=700015 RepID=F2NBE0_CORGP|nr:sialate O-acetylesterase [Coriobacterium glomerans]AEB06676.1 protein of unknown function DUF303 acetylesterase [Coriobacterium glomerans PW2]